MSRGHLPLGFRQLLRDASADPLKMIQLSAKAVSRQLDGTEIDRRSPPHAYIRSLRPTIACAAVCPNVCAERAGANMGRAQTLYPRANQLILSARAGQRNEDSESAAYSNRSFRQSRVIELALAVGRRILALPLE